MKFKDMKKDSFSRTLYYVIRNLDKIPELSEAIRIFRSNKGIKSDFAYSPIDYIRIIFFDCLSIIRTLTSLSDSDLQLVKRINKTRKVIWLETNPLGHHGIDIFYSKLNKKDRNYYWQNLISSLDVGNPIFKNAVNDLSNRMMFASKLAAEGVVLTDGDPRADKVIWGHTKGLKPEATIHFVICHLIDRLTSQIFQKSKNERLNKIVLNKHYLFDPFGDVIFLLTTKNMINPEISLRWELSRDKGGLGWNTPEEQQVFDEEYNKLSK